MTNKGIYKGIYFDDIHSFYDLNLILAPFVPTPAEPKENFIDITGGDGSLDLTEALGEVKYKDRNFEFKFSVNPSDKLTFDEKVSQVSNILNGKRCKITLDRDPEYYWEGRCKVDKYAQDKNLKQISIKATVKPYKLKQNETVVKISLDSGFVNELDINNVTEIDDNTAKVTIENDVLSVELKGNDNITLGKLTDLCPNLKGGETIKITYSANNNMNCFYLYDGNTLISIIGITPNEEMGITNIVTLPEDISNVTLAFNGDFPKTHIISNLTARKTDKLILSNGRKSIVPEITCTNDNTKVIFGNVTETLSAGTHKILDIYLKEGNNILKVSGSGTITFKYQEAEL